MKYQIIGKNIEVTKGIEEALIKKLSKMDKYFVINDDVDCRAVVRTYKTGQKVEVTITTPMMNWLISGFDNYFKFSSNVRLVDSFTNYNIICKTDSSSNNYYFINFQNFC